MKIKIGLPQGIAIKIEVMHSKLFTQRLAPCNAVTVVTEYSFEMRLDIRRWSN